MTALWILIGLALVATMGAVAFLPSPNPPSTDGILRHIRVISALYRIEQRLERMEGSLMAVSQEVQDLVDQVAALKAADAAAAQSVTDAFARLEAKIAAGQGLSQEDKDALAQAKADVAALSGAEGDQKAQADAEGQ